MKTRITLLSILMGVALAAFAFTGCDDDKPNTATIHGTITFKNLNTWTQSGSVSSADSGVVEVVIFPESGWASGTGGTFARVAPVNANNPVIFEIDSTDSTYEYSIDVPPGTYSALAVGYRTNRSYSSASGKKTATLGVHWDHPDSVSYGFTFTGVPGYPAPSPITVSKGDDVTIDFKANYGFISTWFNVWVPVCHNIWIS